MGIRRHAIQETEIDGAKVNVWCALCTICTLYSWRWRRLWTTLQTVVCGISNCKEARLVDFCGLWENASWFESTYSCKVLAAFQCRTLPVYQHLKVDLHPLCKAYLCKAICYTSTFNLLSDISVWSRQTSALNWKNIRSFYIYSNRETHF
jgi:hypothetical protein